MHGPTLCVARCKTGSRGTAEQQQSNITVNRSVTTQARGVPVRMLKFLGRPSVGLRSIPAEVEFVPLPETVA